MVPMDINNLKDQHNRDIDHLNRDIRDLGNKIDCLDDKIQQAINHLHNRLPTWASVVFSLLTASIGYLVSAIIGG